MGSKTRLSISCTKRRKNSQNLLTSRKVNTRLARPITLSTSGAVPYRCKLFRYSLDRYGTACVHTCTRTVRIHVPTLQTDSSVCSGTSPTEYWVSDRNGTVQNERFIYGCGQVERYRERYRTGPKTLVWTG